ncbi:hypothetical protein EYF80_059570 [Liparis tanakae]|uniref:Uncharacterized protein n=1 Tax=Liparis tanakae TaxID=230148 RepID=A0A4Z2EMW3_9TELE|nr:hypothetical protein EYF80_059570 [Liparis tanakae]
MVALQRRARDQLGFILWEPSTPDPRQAAVHRASAHGFTPGGKTSTCERSRGHVKPNHLGTTNVWTDVIDRLIRDISV